MKRFALLLLALAALCTALPAAAAPPAQAGPDRFLPGLPPPAPPPAELRLARAGELAQALSCRQALADPSVSVAPASSPWQRLRGASGFATDQFNSAPQSLRLEGADPGERPAAGQQFGVIPSGLAEVAGALRFRLAAGSADPGDRLRVELYQGPGLSGLIARRELDVSGLGSGAWQSFEWEITDEPTLGQLRGRGATVFAVSTANAGGFGTPRVWLDDLTVDLCAPTASLLGQARQAGGGAAGADLLLVRSDAAGAQVTAAAQTGGDGSFGFRGVPTLAPGASYRVWFLNSSQSVRRDDTRLGFWAGPTVASLGAGAEVGGLSLEIDNVRLTAPTPGATVVATDAQPARFSWGGRRGASGERQRFCLYDPERADPATRQPLQLCGPLLDPSRDPLVFDLAPASFASAPGFGFRYGRSYRWYVVAYGGDPQADPSVPFGYSFYERSVTFAPAAPTAPAPGPALPAGDPAPGAANADWTLLVYIAADNALGDPARTPRRSLPAGQLAGLSAAAAASPGVNLLTYQDDLGAGGARLCAYPAGSSAPDCRARPEPNTAQGQPLSDLISYGRTRYPAARTALLIIAPGGATGLAPDVSAGGHLSLQRLGAAYAAAGLGDAAKLDLLIYQASNLGTLDALRVTAPYARFMVAPSDQAWQVGAIDRLLGVLAGAGRTDAAQAARGSVAAYQAAIDAATPGRALSVAAYDLARAPAAVQAADDLAFVLAEAFAADRATLQPILEAARDGALAYDSSGNGRQNQLLAAGTTVPAKEDALVDLRSFAQRLREANAAPTPVRDEGNDLLTILTDPARTPVITSVQRSGVGLAGGTLTLDGALGLAAFFPSGDRLGGQPALTQSYLYGPDAGAPRESDWATLLRAVLRERIGVGPGGVSEAPGGGAQPPIAVGGVLQTDVRLPLVRR